MIAAIHLNASDWISLASVAVALAALAQSGRAKRAARRAERRLAGEIVRSRTDELEAIEGRIRGAANDSDRSDAEQAIRDWRSIASEHQTLVARAGASDPELDSALAYSLGLVDTALQDLATSAVECEPACRKILLYASRACRHSRRVGAAMMFAK